MTKVRLQKYLAECGVASRRKSEKLMEEGRVKVNGKVTKTLGTKVDPETDKVLVNGRPIKEVHKGLILFHKPLLVVSSKYDPEGRKTVMDFVGPRYRSYYPVGRLDYNTSGLILLTNDGDLAVRMTHPKYEIERVYTAEVRGNVSDPTLKKLGAGVELEDGMIKMKVEVQANKKDTTVLSLTLKEGRNRIIRRTMKRLGHPVQKLKRMRHGPFAIGGLSSGELRKLSERDYQIMRKKVVEPVK